MILKSNGYSRAAMHIVVTLCLAAFIWYVPHPLALWLMAALAGLFFIFELVRLNLWWLNNLFFACLGAVLRPEEWWHPTGAAYVLWGAMATALCFSREIAVAALSFLAVGDAVSSIIGSYLGGRRHRITRPYRTLGCLTACVAASLALSHAGLGLSLPVLLCGALAVTITETLPLPINDNLSLPLVAGAVMWLLCM